MRDNKGLSFVTIMVIIAVLSLALRFGIEKIIEINIAQNESNAQATLKLIAVALENYAKDHLGIYPVDFLVLIQGAPPYLDRDYLAASPIKGYDYSCARLEASGYSCSATSTRCNLTGKKDYIITTGAVLSHEDCSNKD